jgi:hypothetical protein
VLDSNHGAQSEDQSHLSTLAVAQLKKRKLTRAAHQVGRGRITARRRRRRRYAESAPSLVQAETSRSQVSKADLEAEFFKRMRVPTESEL